MAWNADAMAVQAAVNSILLTGKPDVTVTGDHMAGWTVTFGNNESYLTIEAFTPLDVTQKITGFTGRVQNISNLKIRPRHQSSAGLERGGREYRQQGCGRDGRDRRTARSGHVRNRWRDYSVRLREGQGAGIDPNSPIGRLLKKYDDVSSNTVVSFLSGTVGSVFVDAIKDTVKESDYWQKNIKDLVEVADLGVLLDLNWNPGVHIISGMTGGDTYKFSGFWGAAAIVEVPDISVEGVALEVGYDTLDFSGVAADMRIDVWQVTTDNIEYFKSLYKSTTVKSNGEAPEPDHIAIGMNIVFARENSLGAVYNSPLVQKIFSASGIEKTEETIGSVLIANDIENIVGGSGSNQIVLHGGAVLQGTVSAAGTINLDYSDYLGGVPQEQQLLSIGDGNTGTLTLSLETVSGTVTTGSITIGSDTAANVMAIQEGLNDASALGENAVTIQPGAAGTYVVTFSEDRNHSQLEVASSALVDGTNAAVTATVTTLVDGGVGHRG